MRWVNTDPTEVAFVNFVEETSPWALRIAYAFTQGSRDAEDVVQETYFRYWQRLRHTRQPPSRAYLYRALMNNLKSWYRHNRRHILVAQVEKMSDVGSDIAVRDAIARLPLAERTAATAVWVLGLDLDSAAHITGLKPNTLRSRLSRARTRLNRWLKED